MALPAGSPSALQLLQTLAAKACDKDAHVSISAMELLVQLDADVLCNSLTAEQFVGVLQAGLDVLASQCSATAPAGAVGASVCNDDLHGSLQTEVPGLSSEPSQGRMGIKPTTAAEAAPGKARAAGGIKQGNSKVLLSSTGQQQFVQLLRNVLLCNAAVAAAPGSQPQLQSLQGARQWLVCNAQKAVGVGGCRLLLLLLLQDQRLERKWEVLI